MYKYFLILLFTLLLLSKDAEAAGIFGGFWRKKDQNQQTTPKSTASKPSEAKLEVDDFEDINKPDQVVIKHKTYISIDEYTPGKVAPPSSEKKKTVVPEVYIPVKDDPVSFVIEEPTPEETPTGPPASKIPEAPVMPSTRKIPEAPVMPPTASKITKAPLQPITPDDLKTRKSALKPQSERVTPEIKVGQTDDGSLAKELEKRRKAGLENSIIILEDDWKDDAPIAKSIVKTPEPRNELKTNKETKTEPKVTTRATGTTPPPPPPHPSKLRSSPSPNKSDQTATMTLDPNTLGKANLKKVEVPTVKPNIADSPKRSPFEENIMRFRENKSIETQDDEGNESSDWD